MAEIDKVKVGNVIYDIAGSSGNGMYITVDGNTASQAISEGKYIYVQNNATLSKGVYRTTADIANGGTVNTTNTTLDPEGALNELADVRLDMDVTIATSDWSATSPYTYTWTNSHVTGQCAIGVEFLSTATNDGMLYLDFEKVSGGVQFTASSLPTHGIPVRVHIYNVLASSITAISDEMVSSSAVPNASNVEEALEEHEARILTNVSNISANATAISKMSEGMTYVVNGNTSIETTTIPVGSYVRLVNSTITGRSDGIYTVATAIPVNTAIDGTYFNENAPIPGGVANALNSNVSVENLNQSGTVRIVRSGKVRVLEILGATGNEISAITLASSDRPSMGANPPIEELTFTVISVSSTGNKYYGGVVLINPTTGSLRAREYSAYGSSETGASTMTTRVARGSCTYITE